MTSVSGCQVQDNFADLADNAVKLLKNISSVYLILPLRGIVYFRFEFHTPDNFMAGCDICAQRTCIYYLHNNIVFNLLEEA
ncbi:hypothetical protein ABO04_08825 [Nitrosomonas sp. HPC101]|nr:hypothetical protein [Nitrosomonas sp. HPC101]